MNKKEKIKLREALENLEEPDTFLIGMDIIWELLGEKPRMKPYEGETKYLTIEDIRKNKHLKI